jgi:ferritin-like metal-binding protein YciE
MAGLLQEVGERLKRGGNQALIDAGLITDARRVKHYEIAAYTSTIALAETLGLGSIVRLLTFTLREETAADERLSRIAKNEVNPDGALVGAEAEA